MWFIIMEVMWCHRWINTACRLIVVKVWCLCLCLLILHWGRFIRAQILDFPFTLHTLKLPPILLNLSFHVCNLAFSPFWRGCTLSWTTWRHSIFLWRLFVHLLLIHIPLNLYCRSLCFSLRFQVLCNCAFNTCIRLLGTLPPLFLLCSSLLDIFDWLTDDFSFSVLIHVLVIDLRVLTEHICSFIKWLLVAKGISSMSDSWWFGTGFLARWFLFWAKVLLRLVALGVNVKWFVGFDHTLLLYCTFTKLKFVSK